MSEFADRLRRALTLYRERFRYIDIDHYNEDHWKELGDDLIAMDSGMTWVEDRAGGRWVANEDIEDAPLNAQMIRDFIESSSSEPVP